MQPIIGPPRNTLTAAQVEQLLRDDAAPRWSAGLELLNNDLTVQEDLTDDFAGGSVGRKSYANIHGTASFDIARELDWGRAIVRPYVTLIGAVEARFNLGAYYTSTPSRVVESDPLVFDVTGYDILSLLDDTVGDAYAVAAGDTYLGAVEDILLGRGVGGYVIDQTAIASVLPAGKVWARDNKTTWLIVVNDLLAAIGYAGIFSDWDGKLRVQPYQTPLARPAEWTYTVNVNESMMGLRREFINDFYDAPNRWVFVRSNLIEGTTPVEGDGVYTFTNDTNGPTSIEARGGRVITLSESLDVADQAALVAAAQVRIDADLRLSTKLKVTTFPNPLSWHFDRLLVDDPAMGTPLDVLGTAWELNLDGSDMAHEFTVLI